MDIEYMPYTLISRLSVRSRQGALSLIGAVLIGACSQVSMADGAAKNSDRPPGINMKTLRSQVEMLARQDEQMADAPPKVVITGKPTWSSTQSPKRKLLLSVAVSYDSVANRYCRLAVSDPLHNETQLVSLPEQALHDDCLKVESTLFADINSDGFLDVIQVVKIRSNRYADDVSEAVVYLSDSAVSGGYCYSADASEQLAAPDLDSSKSAVRALMNAQHRLGLKGFHCAADS